MKKIIAYGLSFVLCMLACGCSGASGSTKDEFSLYYVNEAENKLVSEAYQPKNTDTAACVQEFLDKQIEEIPNRKKYFHILPDSVHIIGVELAEDGVLTLNLNSDYNTIERPREILARAGLVRTFGQIPGVEFVKINVENEPFTDGQGEEIGLMTPENFVENSGKEINTYQDITMTLYFANEEGTKLEPEERKVYYSSNVPLERVVVEQLIKGPKESGHYATLPSDTNILSATTADGICYVNFDEKVGQDTVSTKEDTAIYSVVDSLVQVCQVQNVQFSINGESNVSLRKSVKLDQLFSWDSSYLNIQ
ncbi:MAG: GerMN domain-containing protein [Lachnospiraceae bacterium]|nr:GerMN domain-containing protein [Lachnospiraceae bacterium]